MAKRVTRRRSSDDSNGELRSPNTSGKKFPKRASAVPSKYAQMTFFDPAARTLRDANGNHVTVTSSVRTPTAQEEREPLSATPRALSDLDCLYACETADEKTIALLAEHAGLRIGQLEHRRLDFTAAREHCPENIPTNRRRCMPCPFWRLHHDKTPF